MCLIHKRIVFHSNNEIMLWHTSIFRLKFGLKPVLLSTVSYSCLKHGNSLSSVIEIQWYLHIIKCEIMKRGIIQVTEIIVKRIISRIFFLWQRNKEISLFFVANSELVSYVQKSWPLYAPQSFYHQQIPVLLEWKSDFSVLSAVLCFVP